jgi:hypothetical protein
MERIAPFLSKSTSKAVSIATHVQSLGCVAISQLDDRKEKKHV